MLTLVSGLAVVGPRAVVVEAEEARASDELVRLAPVDPGLEAASAADEPPLVEGDPLPPEDDSLPRDGGAPPADAASAPVAGPRARGAGSGTSFDLVGVTSTSVPEEPVFVRGLVRGEWTPWFEAHFAPDESPDPGQEGGRPGAHSQPVWIGGATAYELDAPAELGEVVVHLVGDHVVARTVEVQTAQAGAVASLAVEPRSSWGARPPKATPSIAADMKLAVVHHSVNGNTYSADQVPALLRAIQAYHMDSNGWDDIAYNFVVDRFGRIWEGRAGGIDQVVLGGHSAGFNTSSVGVVVLGDFTSAVPSSAALEGVARVIAWKMAIHRVSPSSSVEYTTNGSSRWAPGTTLNLPRVVGHRDTQSTSCPGTQLYTRLGSIRQRVAQLVPTFQPDHVRADVLMADVDGDGRSSALQYRPGPPTDRWWHPGPGLYPSVTDTAVNGVFQPVRGDFDGDGREDVIWHGLGSAADYIWWSRLGGTVSQPVTLGGSFVPSVGDFDGNGVDDVHWYSPGLARDAVWYFERGGSWQSRSAMQDLITGRPMVGDLNGDGLDDLFWYGPGTATDTIWFSQGRSWTSRGVTVDGRFDPVVGDATGDGIDDVIWVGRNGGTSHRWDFTALGSWTSRRLDVPVTSARPFVGDFDADGRDDVLLYGPGAAADAVWWSSPTGVEVRAVGVGGVYEIGVGPIDAALPLSGDDILFASTTGADYLWSGRRDRTFSSTRVG